MQNLALELEYKARKIMNFNDRPIGTIYDSDIIKRNSFIEVMILLLKIKCCSNENEEIEHFADKYSFYIGKSITDIGIEKANAIYNEFESILSSI